MQDLWTYLKSAQKPIFLYGTGNGADKILDELTRLGILVEGVFASDGFVRNRVFRGYPVESYNAVKEKHSDIIVLVCFGSSLLNVMDNIKKIAETDELYVPDVPVIPDGTIFNFDYVKEHRAEIEKAYSFLSDDLSRKTFRDIIFFKLTGELKYLLSTEIEQGEIFNTLEIKNADIFIDLGAYNGDTAMEFLALNKNYKKIFAIEPDAKNYRKLTANLEPFKNIQAINAAVGQEKGRVNFKMAGGRNSLISKEGIEIDQISVDSLETSGSIYIKYDVEGNEISAIKGSFDTLRNEKPILNIAAYHKNSDIFSIPILVKTINPDYNVYMRHHPYIPAWDTNFYFK